MNGGGTPSPPLAGLKRLRPWGVTASDRGHQGSREVAAGRNTELHSGSPGSSTGQAEVSVGLRVLFRGRGERNLARQAQQSQELEPEELLGPCPALKGLAAGPSVTCKGRVLVLLVASGTCLLGHWFWRVLGAPGVGVMALWGPGTGRALLVAEGSQAPQWTSCKLLLCHPPLAPSIFLPRAGGIDPSSVKLRDGSSP